MTAKEDKNDDTRPERLTAAPLGTEASLTAINAADLTKVFRDFWRRPRARAVDGISLRIQRGEVFGLLGPNGSGKSTTLKLILGLLYPTTGTIEVLGATPRDIETKQRIGYLPEESYLYTHLTGRETLLFYANLFKLNRHLRAERTEQLLRMVGLEHAGDRRIAEYSKGMARRIGLAQALVNDPELLILDEPTSGLDPLGCRQVKDLITTLAARGKTVLIASHVLADIEDICDRIAILYNGRIHAQGGLGELLEDRDSCRLSIGAVSPDVLQDILRMIRDKLGRDPYIESSRQNLERFFMEVISKAQQTAGAGSGVARSQGVASYLSQPESTG